jgi:signal transduction histidine kinase/sugar lactone lactonase YvrE
MFGGLDQFDRETGSWRHFRHDPFDPGSLSDDFVSVIFRDRSDALWIGTASGLDRFEPETDTALSEGTFTHYQADPGGPVGSPGNNVRTIHEAREGEFWIGTKGGLYRFDHEEESWSQPYRHDPGDPQSLSDDWVFSFLEDREGIIWLGTLGGGLNRFDPEKETFTHFQNDPADPQSLSNNIVVSIVQDQNGTLWIGNNGGVDRLVPSASSGQALSEAEGLDPGTETFSHYREKDGLSSDSVYCMAEDGQGHLWVSTGKGLSRFDPQSETFENYDVTDGLQSNEFNSNACLLSESGEMVFGGIAGFNTFFPDHIQDNPTIPPIVLTSLAHDAEEIDLGIAFDSVTELTFEWPDNSFEFEFAALSYAQPEKNQYAYLLEGFDEDWNEIGTRRYGKYTNLPGGTYTLHLRGSNNDGLWNEAGTVVRVTIVPPFWATWWFRGVVLVVVLGGAFGGYRLRVRSLKARSRRLESQVEQRTAELLQTEEALKQSEMEKAITGERNRLARDLHDSVTQSLFSLTLFTQAALERAEVGDLDPVKQSLARIADTARTGLKEMRLLVYELRPLALEDEGLVGALRQRLEMVEGRSGVQTRLLVVPEGDVELPAAIEKELYRITQEALNNTLKHANASSITVRLAITPSVMNRDGRHLELEVSDDGCGFDPQAVGDKGGLGLTSIRERVEGLGGELNVVSSPGEGTALRVNVNLSDTEETE